MGDQKGVMRQYWSAWQAVVSAW